MSEINVSGLTFGYEGSAVNIFENVSFRIDTDWRLGFTGRNGRGKTTFLKLLMGEYEYKGKIAASVRFDYFPKEPAEPSAICSDVAKELSGGCEDWRLERELNLLGVSAEILGRGFDTLSNGEKTKLSLAFMFLRENNFLLIDEPTNHLDAEGRAAAADYLKSKKGFILVSHDRRFLDGCVDHVLSINKTDIEIQKGNFSSWIANKERQDKQELERNEALKKDIKRLNEAAKRAGKWSDDVERSKTGDHPYDRGYIGHMAAKMMKRSKSYENRMLSAAEEKRSLLKNIEEAEDLAVKPLLHYKQRLVECMGLGVSYGERKVFENLSFTVGRGERVALCGKNGCGKTSVIKLLLGENIPHSGSVSVASGLVISYVSQDTSWLRGNLREFILERGLNEALLKSILRKLDFSREQFEMRLEDYSEGQKKKLLIARSLCEQAHLYIWDEPLNHIDVISRIQIEELILKHSPSMLFVEHDAVFCENVATVRIVM